MNVFDVAVVYGLDDWDLARYFQKGMRKKWRLSDQGLILDGDKRQLIQYFRFKSCLPVGLAQRIYGKMLNLIVHFTKFWCKN